MEKKLARRKSLRRKYKCYAAAVIGTAIMTGAALPGIPHVSKASAAEKFSSPITSEQTNMLNKGGWHEHNNSWPSSDDNQAWYENGRIYYLNDNAPTHRHYRDEHFQYLISPIEFVKDHGAKLGFDADRDTFTILHQSHRKATVQVIKKDTGQRFKVDLERSHQDWKVVVLRGIGDAHFPASYRML